MGNVGKISSQLNFGVCKSGYVTLKNLTFRNVTVPKGFIFDGVTVRAPFTIIFSQKNLRNGIRASCFHDYCCENKLKFGRQESTKILCDVWKKDGLGKIKAFVVYFFVEIYQKLKGWK